MRGTQRSLAKVLNLRKAGKALFTLLGLLCCLALAGLVLAQTSTSFDQSWHVLSGVGAPASSASFAVDGSLSQLAIGIAEGSNYRVESGYWYGPVTCVIAGDLDCNCEVNVDDIIPVASRWRTSCEKPDPDNNSATPNYEPYYDLDHDGIINVVDIMKVVVHLGETCE